MGISSLWPLCPCCFRIVPDRRSLALSIVCIKSNHSSWHNRFHCDGNHFLLIVKIFPIFALSIGTLHIDESDVLHTFFNHIKPAEEHGGLITDYDDNPFKADSSSAIRRGYLVLRKAEPAATEA